MKKQLGRPRLGVTKTVATTIRFTEAQMVALRAKFPGRSFAAAVRVCVFRQLLKEDV